MWNIIDPLDRDTHIFQKLKECIREWNATFGCKCYQGIYMDFEMFGIGAALFVLGAALFVLGAALFVLHGRLL